MFVFFRNVVHNFNDSLKTFTVKNTKYCEEIRSFPIVA